MNHTSTLTRFVSTLGSPKPFLEITVPEPVVWPTSRVFTFILLVLALDYVLLSNERKLPCTWGQLRAWLTLVHILLPTFILTPSKVFNGLFSFVPWVLVSYASILPLDRMSLRELAVALCGVCLDLSDQERRLLRIDPMQAIARILKDRSVHNRRLGLVKMGRGLLKLALAKVLVEHVILADHKTLLSFPWMSIQSLTHTFLLGLFAYCLFGGMDIFFGFNQLVLGIRFVDVCRSPILAPSVTDFWSRRWNMVVRNLLHVLLFTGVHPTNGKTPSSPWMRNARGLLVFFISGAFHELIVIILTRKMTLENFIFFMLHGLASLIKVTYFPSKGRPDAQGLTRFCCILQNMGFFILTGRLFLAPFVRYDFMNLIGK